MAVYDDDVVSNRDVRRNSSSAFSWIVPLLLIVAAFFAGWWTNAYTNNNNAGSGFQPGVGGGPGNNVNNVAPTRGSSIVGPTTTPIVSITPTPTSVPMTTP